MRYRKGKYVRIDPRNPAAVGICDATGIIFNKRDLVRQMEWRGNALVWTGYLVGRPYLDEPNQQGRPAIFPPDPIPIIEPRPPQGKVNAWQENPYSWNLYGMAWDIDDERIDGVMELPYAINIAQLQNINWNSAG